MSDKLYTVVAVEKGVSRVTSCHDGVDNEEDMPNNRFEQFIMEYLEFKQAKDIYNFKDV
jgi:hypothetical protein